MARFPNSEAGIVALARAVIAGLNNNPDLHQASPISVSELETALAEYDEAKSVATAAGAHAVQSTAVKNTTVRTVARRVKRVLRFAESEVGTTTSTCGSSAGERPGSLLRWRSRVSHSTSAF